MPLFPSRQTTFQDIFPAVVAIPPSADGFRRDALRMRLNGQRQCARA